MRVQCSVRLLLRERRDESIPQLSCQPSEIRSWHIHFPPHWDNVRGSPDMRGPRTRAEVGTGSERRKWVVESGIYVSAALGPAGSVQSQAQPQPKFANRTRAPRVSDPAESGEGARFYVSSARGKLTYLERKQPFSCRAWESHAVSRLSRGE